MACPQLRRDDVALVIADVCAFAASTPIDCAACNNGSGSGLRTGSVSPPISTAAA
jgi:hypothetical protein